MAGHPDISRQPRSAYENSRQPPFFGAAGSYLSCPSSVQCIMSAMVAVASVMFAGTNQALIVMALARPKPKKSATSMAAPGPIELAPLAVLNLGLFDMVSGLAELVAQ